MGLNTWGGDQLPGAAGGGGGTTITRNPCLWPAAPGSRVFNAFFLSPLCLLCFFFPFSLILERALYPLFLYLLLFSLSFFPLGHGVLVRDYPSTYLCRCLYTRAYHPV